MNPGIIFFEMVLLIATAANAMSTKDRDDALPIFRDTDCPAKYTLVSVCIEVDFQDGGEKDLLLLTEDPKSPTILEGRLEKLEGKSIVEVLVFLPDENNPDKKMISFDSERVASCAKFFVDIKTGQTTCPQLPQLQTADDDESRDKEETESRKENERSLLEQTLSPRAVNTGGYRLSVLVYFDNPFYAKFQSSYATMIHQIMAVVKQEYSESSFPTKLDISYNIQYSNSNWDKAWQGLDTRGAVYKELSSIARNSGTEANLYVFLTDSPTQSYYGFAKIGSLCDVARDKRISITRFVNNAAFTGETVAHEMAHNLGITHDCINGVCGGDYSKGYKGPRTGSDGRQCYGYMDYIPSTNGWSTCSKSDFRTYVNKQRNYCLQPINQGNACNPVDTLPNGYQCNYSCSVWASNGLCQRDVKDWGCVSYSSGAIGNYCKASCNACG